MFDCDNTPITCSARLGLATTSTPATSARPLVGTTGVVGMPTVVVFGAVGPEQAEDLAFGHLRVEAVDGP